MDSRRKQKSKSERHVRMPHNLLIVDELATNRIVLKVKLSGARYGVMQASSIAEALDLMAREAPDLVIASGAVGNGQPAETVTALRDHPAGANLPIVILSTQDDPDQKLEALRAGASDVLCKPLRDDLLLARLRSLLRQHQMDHPLLLQADTARALGFAEPPNAFRHPGRIALMAQSMTEAMQLRASIMHFSRDDMALLPFDATGGLVDLSPSPDVVVLSIQGSDCDEGLRMMADLRADPTTHDSRIFVLLGPGADPLAATLLDMGAHDVLCDPHDPREVALRLQSQMQHKRRDDGLRSQLESGLQAAVTDQLTGLHNRRFALPFLTRAIAHAADHRTPLTVMVADLDHFKMINDSHGHAAGDAVLRRVAGLLRRTLRERDMLARIGGEEFLMVLPDTSRNRARQIASRLCRSVRETLITSSAATQPLNVTISIGVAPVELRPGKTLPAAETLIAQADRALYGAKAGGRNTVSFCATRPAA
jgi:two-component system cell cycle response regulator